jgi:Cd2+/Zn2+-exporting ATPase
MGIVATVDGHDVIVGNSDLMKKEKIEIPSEVSSELFVAVDYKYAGRIFVTDAIKTEAEQAIGSLKSLGVQHTVMLSGDRRQNAERVASALGIDEVRYELLPEEKYEHLIKIKESSGATVYVGDGINDAPSLVTANVGIAMGGVGSDSAIEAADVVIMNDNLSKLTLAIRIARKTLGIAKVNIVFALAVKLLILLLGAFGFANMWLAVFADVGVALIAILNSMRALRIKG